jgi:hypothetical protein
VVVPRAHTINTLYVRARLALGTAGASKRDLTNFHDQARRAATANARREVIGSWVDVRICPRCPTSCLQPNTCTPPASVEAWSGHSLERDAQG